MSDRLDEGQWKQVEIIGYCPLMSQGSTMVDCKKEKCTWWREARQGRPKGKAACAVNDLISQLSTSQLVILNGRFQTFIKDGAKK